MKNLLSTFSVLARYGPFWLLAWSRMKKFHFFHKTQLYWRLFLKGPVTYLIQVLTLRRSLTFFKLPFCTVDISNFSVLLLLVLNSLFSTLFIRLAILYLECVLNFYSNWLVFRSAHYAPEVLHIYWWVFWELVIFEAFQQKFEFPALCIFSDSCPGLINIAM